MRSVEAILSDTTTSDAGARLTYSQLVNKLTRHTIEIDLNALEKAGKWGVARVNIAGKTYQLFPVEAA